MSYFPKTGITDAAGTDINLGQTTRSASLPVTFASDQTNLPANITQVNGSAISLGQKTSAASLPVAVSSDYNLPTISAQATRTIDNISSNGGTVSASVSQYSVATITLKGTYSGLTIVFEASDDGGTTWFAIQASDASAPNTASSSVTLADNSTKMYNVTLPGVTNFRIRSTAYTSGTLNVRITPTADPMVFNAAVGVVSGTNTIGKTLSAQNEVSFTTATAQAVGTTDAGGNGYQSVSVHIASQGTSATVSFQGSNDNTNWFSISLMNAGNTQSAAAVNTTATGIFYGTLPCRYFRLNVTGIASGTTSGVMEFYDKPLPYFSIGGSVVAGGVVPSGTTDSGSPLKTGTKVNTTLPTFTNGQRADTQGDVRGATLIAPMATATSGAGATSATLISAASTNATSLKASAGNVYSINVGNNSTTQIVYLKLYNKASSPTVGTDTPVAVFIVPAASVGGAGSNLTFPVGKAFTTGIAYAITGGIAHTDNTAVSANQVCVTFDYL